MVAAALRTIFAQPDQAAARRQLRIVYEAMLTRWPKAAQVLTAVEEDILAYMTFPEEHWKRIYSNNVLERLNKEIKRRTNVVGVFPDEAYKIANNLNDFTEGNLLVALNFLTPRGWQGGITNRVVYQYVRNRSADCFDLVNLRFGKELAKKRGLITLEVQNLFNRHFDFLIEPRRSFIPDEFFPARRFVGKVQLWF